MNIYCERDASWYHWCSGEKPEGAPNESGVVFGPGMFAAEYRGWAPDDGWAVQANDYFVPITYCPYCGVKLETPSMDKEG